MLHKVAPPPLYLKIHTTTQQNKIKYKYDKIIYSKYLKGFICLGFLQK